MKTARVKRAVTPTRCGSRHCAASSTQRASEALDALSGLLFTSQRVELHLRSWWTMRRYRSNLEEPTIYYNILSVRVSLHSPLPSLCLSVCVAFSTSGGWAVIHDRLRTKAHAKRAGKAWRWGEELTGGGSSSGWWWCWGWRNLTCHRSRNLRPACSDRDPQPRRCTPAPWSSLKGGVGEEPG